MVILTAKFVIVLMSLKIRKMIIMCKCKKERTTWSEFYVK